MRLIIYCLTTLAAWIVSQRLLSSSYDERHNTYKSHNVIHQERLKHNTRRSILSYINPLFWALYLWHGIQMHVLRYSSYIYYACPLAWFSGLIIILTKLMWYSRRWQKYIILIKKDHKRANYALKKINTRKKLKFLSHRREDSS